MLRPVIGVVLCLVGVVWFLQGIDTLGGSGMSGQIIWAWIGAPLALLGVWILAGPSLRRRLGR